MSERGDIWLTDLNDERRRRALVVSTDRFARASGRVLVAPELLGDAVSVPYPWRVEVDAAVFALDLLQSLPESRLLERVDRAPAGVVEAARRALRHIT